MAPHLHTNTSSLCVSVCHASVSDAAVVLGATREWELFGLGVPVQGFSVGTSERRLIVMEEEVRESLQWKE